MNNKIPFNQLASKMADRAGVSVPGAESMIKAFFAVVEEGLAESESVKIKGFGTFRLSGNPDSPVIFNPDTEVAEAVNAPFSMFVAEEIDPQITDSMLEAVDAVEHVEPEIADIPVAPEPEPEPIPEPLPEPEPEPQPEPEPEPDPEPEPEPEPDEQTIAPPAYEPAAKEIPVGDETPAIPPVPPVPVAVPPVEETDDDYEEPVEEKAGSTFWPGFIIGLVTGLAIGALAVFIYMSENLSSEKPEANPVEISAAV